MSTALTPRQRQHLKALAHNLQPVVQLGASGLTPGVTQAARDAMRRHEIIKVKLPKLEAAERESLAVDLTSRSGGTMVQLLGRVLILYTEREEDLPGKPRIQLPK